MSFLVAIATCNRPRLLARTLHSLARCTKPAGYLGTVVVENGGSHSAEAVVRSFKQSLKTRYLHEPIGNKCLALNRILEVVDDGLIFFTDDDTRLDEKTLVAYGEAARRSQGREFFGGPTGVDYQRRPPEWLIPYLPPSARGFAWDGADVMEPVFLGFNWAAYACDLKRVGGFDGRIGPGSGTGSVGDETDMQRRLLADGLRGVYVDGAMVWHYVAASRSTAHWAAERIYRWGIGRGMTNQPPIPKRLMRRWIRSGIGVARSCARGGVEERFAAMYNFRKFSGVVRGHWLSRWRRARSGTANVGAVGREVRGQQAAVHSLDGAR